MIAQSLATEFTQRDAAAFTFGGGGAIVDESMAGAGSIATGAATGSMLGALATMGAAGAAVTGAAATGGGCVTGSACCSTFAAAGASPAPRRSHVIPTMPATATAPTIFHMRGVFGGGSGVVPHHLHDPMCAG